MQMKKSTDELMKELKEAKDIKQYIKDNAGDVVSGGLRKYITDMAKEKKMTIGEVAGRSQLSRSYLYKINEDVKVNMSRDVVIRICFGLGLDADEGIMLMCAAGAGGLCPRIRRDCIIMFCLQNRIDITECGHMLEETGEAPILRE
ncbi:MAG: hypothetical protein ACI4TH_01730, partial [Candidatus Ornithomonoglobus sp.]